MHWTIQWSWSLKAAILRESTVEGVAGQSLIVLTAGAVRGGPLAAVTGAGRPIAAIIDMTDDDAAERLGEAVESLRS